VVKHAMNCEAFPIDAGKSRDVYQTLCSKHEIGMLTHIVCIIVAIIVI
jgi:hypothetical protein